MYDEEGNYVGPALGKDGLPKRKKAKTANTDPAGADAAAPPSVDPFSQQDRNHGGLSLSVCLWGIQPRRLPRAMSCGLHLQPPENAQFIYNVFFAFCHPQCRPKYVGDLLNTEIKSPKSKTPPQGLGLGIGNQNDTPPPFPCKP